MQLRRHPELFLFVYFTYITFLIYITKVYELKVSELFDQTIVFVELSFAWFSFSLSTISDQTKASITPLQTFGLTRMSHRACTACRLLMPGTKSPVSHQAWRHLLQRPSTKQRVRLERALKGRLAPTYSSTISTYSSFIKSNNFYSTNKSVAKLTSIHWQVYAVQTCWDCFSDKNLWSCFLIISVRKTVFLTLFILPWHLLYLCLPPIHLWNQIFKAFYDIWSLKQLNSLKYQLLRITNDNLFDTLFYGPLTHKT